MDVGESELDVGAMSLSGSENAERLWADASAVLRVEVADGTWQSTFASVTAMRIDDADELVLGVPNGIARDRIEGRYGPLVQGVISEAAGRPMRFSLELLPTTLFDLEGEPTPAVSPTELETSSPATPPPAAADHRYSFDGFVIGPSNRFAHAAALSVAERPGGSYNPLFIYGGAGLGKTHLLRAIARYVNDVYPNLRVLYVSTETFLNELVTSIRTNTQDDFKRRYRGIDVLLVDDIQFIAGREGLQEEFFHTFNDLYASNSQIVLSSDRQPDAIPTLEDRLRSRFMMGLQTDIQPPDVETRMAILQTKAERDGYFLPTEVATFIATHITTNIRELEGALNKVTAFANLNNEPMTEQLAERVLWDFIADRQPRPITVSMILDATAEQFGFEITELVGKSRRRPLVTARQIAMYQARQLTEHSFPTIGREFGGRDHTTVMHACDKIAALMQERPQIYDQVNALEKAVRAAAKAGD